MGRVCFKLFVLSASLACRGAQPALRLPDDPEEAVVRIHDGGSVVSVARRPAEGCPARAPRAHWGPGTTHGATVTASETWTRAGSPHRVPFGVHLLAGASLRVEPCAVVLVGTGQAIVVQGDARLLAVGSAAEPIRFDALGESPSHGDWIGLEVRAHGLPDTRLAHVTIAHAGADPGLPGEPPAALRTRSRAGLRLESVLIQNSGGYGVALLENGIFASGSHGLTVEGSHGEGAVYIADVNAVRSLPTGHFRNNANNDVLLAATQRVLRVESALRALDDGARYRLRRAARWIVQGTSAPRLTLAAGVVLAMEAEASLEVGLELPGALLAQGQGSSRLVRLVAATGDTGAPSWGALVLGAQTDTARTHLQDMEILGAGGEVTGVFDSCPSAGTADVDSRGMLVLSGASAAMVVAGLRFVAGPRNGFAILRANAPPLPLMDFTRLSQHNDFRRAGVRCASSQPSLGGRCPPTPGCS